MTNDKSTGQAYYIDDFTTTEYTSLLKLGKLNYSFITYDQIDLDKKSILWRHDCDYSLNRALRLAQLEKDESVVSTYFLNPHCEFYNILEKSQTKIVEKILMLGHSIGLHFDATYYDVSSEDQLDDLVAQEATWLKKWFGVEVSAFSFHNPTNLTLECEKSQYGGLVNCYSDLFKKNVSYCSDSNGFWRFRRLRDLLEEATDHSLQILTHPCWWQEVAMYPRDRIVRAVQGRAAAVMMEYDHFLQKCGRKNISQ